MVALCCAWSRATGLGVGRIGVVPGAACGLVAGPVCRACGEAAAAGSAARRGVRVAGVWSQQ